MSNESFLSVPINVSSPIELRKFLLRLVEKLDIVFGYRGDDTYVGSADLKEAEGSIDAAIAAAVQASAAAILNEIDGRNYTANPEQTTIADETLYSGTASVAYTQAELQGVMDQVSSLTDKVNSVLAALRAANIIEV